MDIINALALARRLMEAVAEGRLEASKVKDMTDDELAAYDTLAYQALLGAQAENERLVGEDPAAD